MTSPFEEAARACERRGDHVGAVFCRLQEVAAKGAQELPYIKSGGRAYTGAAARLAYGEMNLSTKAARLEALDYAKRLVNAGRLDEARALMDRIQGQQGATKAGPMTTDQQMARAMASIRPPAAPAWVKSFDPETVAFIRYVKSGTKATNIESQLSLGGALVPAEVAKRVMGRVLQASVVRGRATVVTTDTDQATVPVVAGGDDAHPSNLRGAWLSETQSMGDAQALQLGAAKAPVNLIKAKVLLSRSLVEDADPALLLSTLERFGGTAVANAEDRAFLVGSGVGEPLGILAQQASGVLANGDIRVTTATGSVTGDALVAAFHALPGAFRSAPGFCWTMNKDTLEVVRLLKDGAGRYVFDEAAGLLLGKPIAESEHMPSIAQNAFPVLCGDFEGYQISDRTELTVQRWDDVALANEDQLRYDFRRRVGGTPAEGYRFSVVKVV